MAASFIDSNVLLYLASSDAVKADQAEAVVARGDAVISVQVLNEIANVARRKMRLTWPQTRALLTALRDLLPVAPLTIETHDAGLVLAERYGLSIYDAMIVAAALQSGCETLWSEDMQDGLLIDRRLKIRNPFRQTV